MNNPKTVFITGCSSGIGAALAQEFHKRGHRVFASARRLAALQDLQDQGVQTLELDVNDGASIGRALTTLQSTTGHIDILINNAGYGQFGAIMDAETEDLRQQFETNVFAPVAVTRAALPLLRQNGAGLVANMGSVSGILTTPFAGIYCASKAALHAVSDAMRLELAALGVQVVTIQAGGIASNFGATGATQVKLPLGSLYTPISRYVLGRAKASQRGATPVDLFAREVVDHLLQAKPPAVCRTGAHSTRLTMLKRWLPTRMLDRKLQKLFGLNQL